MDIHGIIRFNKDELKNLEKSVNLQHPNNKQKWGSVTEWAIERHTRKPNKNRLETIHEFIIEESKLCDIKRKYSKSIFEPFSQFEPFEDREIYKYILIHNYEGEVVGKKIWQEMEMAIFPNRKWKSLRKRYLQRLIKEPLLSQFVTAKGKAILLKKFKKNKNNKNKKNKIKQNERDDFSIKKHIKII
ncbi:uncharacterized protein LOC123305778 [Chrysoperla carnea]|uniref:uncharacterized protein LOC123305778 n=1 Tax=Chrysoperla carnea TaxID=189513 RepID=UPI001D06979A|nr:uncharacterized protein LOC123305778 [Chrysoperla carnea]XP_044743536.1 uncharacterized protein LOC123305778 [Chrysoperla carnea]XP_044743537.1 uncharacterized protein LOC123305778 [Chrysoperla carnea]